MSKKKTPKRNYRSAAEKARILRRHLEDKEPISKIGEEEGLQPSVFYGWQRDLFARMEGALAMKPGQRDREREQLEQRVETLEAKLATKNEVIAAVSEEIIALKKGFGEI